MVLGIIVGPFYFCPRFRFTAKPHGRGRMSIGPKQRASHGSERCRRPAGPTALADRTKPGKNKSWLPGLI